MLRVTFRVGVMANSQSFPQSSGPHNGAAEMQLASGVLTYRQWGTDGEPVLLLHGLGDHGLVWQSLAMASDRIHWVAPDLRGHGNSHKPAQGYSSQDIIPDLEALMDHLGWDSAHVVSHSWSSKIALVWAQQSDRIRSLVLVDPFFVGKLPGWMRLTIPILYRTLPFIRAMGPFPNYAAAEQFAKGMKQYRGWSALQQQVVQFGLEPKPDGAWGSKFTTQARDGVFDDILKTDGLTNAIAIPTLLLLPEQGLNRMAWQTRPYFTYLKQMRSQILPGNHWCFLVEPDAFNRAVLTFLEPFLNNQA